MGTDDDAKASLLFCLDKYLDPYFGYNRSYTDEIVDLLETVVVSSNSMDIREDALDLLTSYAGRPFPILEKHYDGLPEAIKPNVKYAINLNAKEVYLSYIFEPQYGRGFKYQIQMKETNFESVGFFNPQVLWVMY